MLTKELSPLLFVVPSRPKLINVPEIVKLVVPYGGSSNLVGKVTKLLTNGTANAFIN